jgi:hypothetical protein
MANSTTVRLDEAYEALRAWCHERPDVCDPAGSYTAFGTIGAIMATLEHIVRLTARSTRRATATDDGRSISGATEVIDRRTGEAIQLLNDAYRMIGSAHSMTGHLIFAIDDDGSEVHAVQPETA